MPASVTVVPLAVWFTNGVLLTWVMPVAPVMNTGHPAAKPLAAVTTAGFA